MTQKMVERINERSAGYTFLEFCLYELKDDRLVVAVSEDLLYYHNFEIHFLGVFSIVCNSTWKLSETKNCISILDGIHSREVNIKYRVETDNVVFKIANNDDLEFYVIAQDVILVDKLVKYYV